MPVAVFCPSTPLLVKDVSGGRVDEVEKVREAALAAVGLLVAEAASVTLVAADRCLPAAADARAWPASCEGTLGGFGVAVDGGAACGLPPALAVGRRLLTEAGFSWALRQYAVSLDAPPTRCAALGEALAGDHLLLLGDASICRSEDGPGGPDPDALPHDMLVARALATGDAHALVVLDVARSARLGVTGRAPWQVLAGWAGGRQVLAASLRYCDAPFGVGYMVGSWTVGADAS